MIPLPITARIEPHPAALARAVNEATMREWPLDSETLIDNGIVGFEYMDIRARPFILLRAQIINNFHRMGGRVLAVTSTQPGNGKTHIAANAAAALSRIHPTIIVDLDLRRPAVAARFGLPPGDGIDDYLAGDVAWEATGTRIESANLTIHAVRAPRPNAASLLASERLGDMLDAMRHLPGDPICIVDTPPALMVDDIMLIARNVDGILMIVEEGRTRGSDIADALRLLAPTPVIGSVLNKSMTARTPSDHGGYYGAVPD